MVYILKNRGSDIKDPLASYDGSKLSEKEKRKIAELVEAGNNLLIFQTEEQTGHGYTNLLHELGGKFSKLTTLFRKKENSQSRTSEKRLFTIDTEMEGYWELSDDLTRMTRVELMEDVLLYEFLFQRGDGERKTNAMVTGNRQGAPPILLESEQYVALKSYNSGKSSELDFGKKLNGPYIPQTFYVEIHVRDDGIYTKDLVVGL